MKTAIAGLGAHLARSRCYLPNVHCLLRPAHQIALCVLLVGACDDAKPVAKTETADAKTDAKTESAADDKRAARVKRDRGSMTAQIGGVAWTGECNARPGDQPDELRLSCSTMSTENGVAKRDSIQLSIAEYKGVGDYTAKSGNFTRVSLDTAAAKSAVAAGEDGKQPAEAKQVEVLTKSISDAGVFFIKGATVSITAVSDTQVEGTLAWTPGPEGGPKIEQATFRAVIEPKTQVRPLSGG